LNERKNLFKCVNPAKYMGNPTRIVYRSWWEFKYMTELDHDPSVVGWQSEEFFILYISPVDRRSHRYFPDFLVKKKNSAGIIETFIIEIKPACQTVPPKRGLKRARTYQNEVYRYGVNERKFEAAQRYASKRGWKFKILTEKELKIP